jgi:hypothetical protein
MGQAIIEPALQGSVELLQRFRHPALALQKDTEVVMGFSIGGIGIDRPPNGFHGFLVPAVLHKQRAVVMVGLGKLIRVERQDGAIVLFRFLDVGHASVQNVEIDVGHRQLSIELGRPLGCGDGVCETPNLLQCDPALKIRGGAHVQSAQRVAERVVDGGNDILASLMKAQRCLKLVAFASTIPLDGAPVLLETSDNSS